MEEILSRLREIEKEDPEMNNMDLFLVRLFVQQIDLKEEEMIINKDAFIRKLEEKKKVQLERKNKLDEIIKRSKNTKFWGVLEKTASALALAAGVAVTGGNALVGWKLLSFALALGFSIDELAGDKIKSTLAKWASLGNENREKNIETFLRLGSAAIVMSAVALLNGMTLIHTLGNLSKGVSTGVRTYNEYKSDQESGELLLINETISQAEDKVKESLQKNKRLIESLYQTYKNLIQLIKTQHETAISFPREIR